MDLRCKYSQKHGVAITGATGFIGSHLVEVFGVDNFEPRPFESVDADSIIMHLAADVSPTREALLSNISMDTYVLERTNLRHKGLIYASSNSVYPYAFNCRINELQRFNNYYAASKILGEGIISELATVPAISVRIADVFGVGQRHGNFFKAIEKAIRTNTTFNLYGKGSKRRTYIHVKELCEMLKFITSERLEFSQPGDILNLGYSEPASIFEIVSIVKDLTRIEVIQTHAEDDISEADVRTMNVSKLYGYKPRWISFRDAVKSYVNEIRS